jgi:diguanylate cyclase (GGDEF)-like protein
LQFPHLLAVTGCGQVEREQRYDAAPLPKCALQPAMMHGYRSSAVVLICLAIAGIGGSVLVIGLWQRGEVISAGQATVLQTEILGSMIDSRDAVQDHLDSPGQGELSRFASDQVRITDALRHATKFSAEDPALRESLVAQKALMSEWDAEAQRILTYGRMSASQHAQVDRISNRLRVLSAGYVARSTDVRADELRTASIAEGAVVLVGSVLALMAALQLVRRGARAERARQALEVHERFDQRELADSLQVANGEDETYALLRRHILRSFPVNDAVVLNRDNSNDRLEARTPAPPEVADVLVDVSPDACLAVRLGRAHSHGPEREPLLACTVCGLLERATCVPSLVNGEVIGSVLASHTEPLSEREHARLGESVAQAAPVLANLRNLAIAETRAMTDALTGLANARALQDTMKRMIAHAGRSLSPLSLVALDLDHFKEINDRWGHDKGDEALAAVGALLAALRTSDFAARNGGEEFVLLLPDTDKQAALEVADTLRKRLADIPIPGIERRITASFGVASYPADATEPNLLLRAADRALYMAKASGRNAVQASQLTAPYTGAATLTEEELRGPTELRPIAE